MRPTLSSAAAIALAVFAVIGNEARAETSSLKPNASQPAQLVNDEKVSPADRETRVEKSLEQMRGQETAMEKIAAQARSEKDIVKLDCVNVKVNQAKGLLRITEAAQGDLHEASARGDEDGARNAFTKATIAGRKVTQLRQEAEQCIGQLAYYTDDKTRVDVEVPAGLPNSDPTYVALPGPVDSRPAPASGF